MSLTQIIGSLELGLIYGIVALAVYMSFRILDFPDMTVDGSLPLGASICAALMVHGMDPWTAVLLAFFGGCLAGLVTGILNVRFKILGLLSGILTMTALYSVNLRIMGRPNIALMAENSVFDAVKPWALLMVLVGLIWILLYSFFMTDLGLGIRAIGINPRVSRAYGVSVSRMTLLTLSFSNGLVALAGALLCQMQGFADVNMGLGTIVIGLASVILGEAILPSRSLLWRFFACILGSLLYRIVIALALNAGDFGLKSSDLNLVTAAIVALTMIASRRKS
ncbi:MAG: ABC transporter permease [Verrucomicrobia bacterium GWF2_51_19]|nr:MAG: ABC transporter permease [Verrucomicrobia bacterium GWF2_51_19]HCJ11519.1 ABC transporter permease [Opitutae bacterium]